MGSQQLLSPKVKALITLSIPVALISLYYASRTYGLAIKTDRFRQEAANDADALYNKFKHQQTIIAKGERLEPSFDHLLAKK